MRERDRQEEGHKEGGEREAKSEKGKRKRAEIGWGERRKEGRE